VNLHLFNNVRYRWFFLLKMYGIPLLPQKPNTNQPNNFEVFPSISFISNEDLKIEKHDYGVCLIKHKKSQPIWRRKKKMLQCICTSTSSAESWELLSRTHHLTESSFVGIICSSIVFKHIKRLWGELSCSIIEIWYYIKSDFLKHCVKYQNDV